MRKYLYILLLVIILSFPLSNFVPLFSQPNYPEIPYSELEDYVYEIIHEDTYYDYYIVKVEGVVYIVYY